VLIAFVIDRVLDAASGVISGTPRHESTI